jgi:2-methylcitrate dehydratase PrpD
MSLIRDLARLIRAKPVSDADLAWASLFVADTLACAYGARETPAARALATVAPWAAGDTGRRAFHFGGLAHILELDDLHRTSVTHPGTVVIPAAAALAEAEELSGRAFLTAVLRGYEACCRVGNAVGPEHYRVWHNTSTCGPFGAAMAAASALDLDEDQTVWALGNAGTQSSGLWEFLSAGAMSKHLHTARAAESGVLAALLAREGFTGAETILEGEKGFFVGLCADPLPEAVTRDPQAPWELIATSIKPWPCCRHTHPAIDAAIALHDQIGDKDIAQIEIGVYQAAIDVCDRPAPTDPYGAKFSLQHCVAEALATGQVGLASFGDDRRAVLAGLRERTTLASDADVQAGYPDAWGARIAVTTQDGRRLEEIRRVCKGDPDNPLEKPALSRKAAELFEMGGMPAREADATLEAIYAMAEDGPVDGLFTRLFDKTQTQMPLTRLQA